MMDQNTVQQSLNENLTKLLQMENTERVRLEKIVEELRRSQERPKSAQDQNEINQKIGIREIIHSNFVFAVSFSSDGRYLATGSED